MLLFFVVFLIIKKDCSFCVFMFKKLVRFKQKGQKQASFLAFHKCCQGCLLRSPRYISTSFILVCALRCTYLQGTRKVYSQAEKFIRLVRIKQKCIRIAYLYSKCTDCRIKINIMFKEIMPVATLIIPPMRLKTADLLVTDQVYVSLRSNDFDRSST
jgi:hypothetical protein